MIESEREVSVLAIYCHIPTTLHLEIQNSNHFIVLPDSVNQELVKSMMGTSVFCITMSGDPTGKLWVGVTQQVEARTI